MQVSSTWPLGCRARSRRLDAVRVVAGRPLDVSRSERDPRPHFGVGALGLDGRYSPGLAIFCVGRSGVPSPARAVVSVMHCTARPGKHLRRGLKSWSRCCMAIPPAFERTGRPGRLFVFHTDCLRYCIWVRVLTTRSCFLRLSASGTKSSLLLAVA